MIALMCRSGSAAVTVTFVDSSPPFSDQDRKVNTFVPGVVRRNVQTAERDVSRGYVPESQVEAVPKPIPIPSLRVVWRSTRITPGGRTVFSRCTPRGDVGGVRDGRRDGEVVSDDGSRRARDPAQRGGGRGIAQDDVRGHPEVNGLGDVEVVGLHAVHAGGGVVDHHVLDVVHHRCRGVVPALPAPQSLLKSTQRSTSLLTATRAPAPAAGSSQVRTMMSLSVPAGTLMSPKIQFPVPTELAQNQLVLHPFALKSAQCEE